MKLKLIFVMLTVSFLFYSHASKACDYSIVGQGISPLEHTEERSLSVRLNSRYTVLNTFFSGNDEIDDLEGEKETHFTTEVTGAYRFSNRFTILGILPLPKRTISVDADVEHLQDEHDDDSHAAPASEDNLIHRHEASGSSFGFGDLSVLGRVHLFKNENTAVALQTGFKVPTGGTDALDDAGSFLDAHIQPGTGAWDFRVGGAFNHVNNHFSISSNILYSINTTGEAGNDDYRYGNWLNADVTAKYRILSSGMNRGGLSLAFGINGEFRDREKINDREIENTGGEVLYFSPALQLEISGLTIETSFQYPFYHHLNGEAQLGEDFKSFLSINYGL